MDLRRMQVRPLTYTARIAPKEALERVFDFAYHAQHDQRTDTDHEDPRCRSEYERENRTPLR